MKQRHNNKKGFSLVEAAIVLAVIGLVVAGIWVAAAALKKRHFEQKFMEGFVVLKNNSQKYITQSESCGGGSLHNQPNFYPLLQPTQWKEIGVNPSGEIDISMYIGCEGTSTFFPNEKYLRVRFWRLKQDEHLPFFCQSIFRKVEALCSRSMDCYMDLANLNYQCGRTQTDLDIYLRTGRTR